jgi:hypothetical protein
LKDIVKKEEQKGGGDREAVYADFSKQVLTGSVTLGVRKVEEQARQLKLDCSKLDIAEVKDDGSGKSLDCKVGEAGPCGVELTVTLPCRASVQMSLVSI